MTIMNILSSDDEDLKKSKQKTSKDMASPSVLLGQQNIVQNYKKSKKKKTAKSKTSSSVTKPGNNEKYFQVEKSVAKSFGSTDSTSFSLLSLFGRDTVSGKQDNEDEPVETKEHHQSHSKLRSKKYNEIDVSGQQHKKVAASLVGHRHPTALPPTTTATAVKKMNNLVLPQKRTLFFVEDDPRLSDGVKYFHRKHSEDELWTKWTSGFKNEVRNLLITRRKRALKSISDGYDKLPKKMKFNENNLHK